MHYKRYQRANGTKEQLRERLATAGKIDIAM